MILFGLKNCDTCKKARRALPQADYVDVRDDGMPADVLQVALAQFGDALLNTRSTTWRGLSDADKARAPLDLLRDHPTLMKRPLIQDGGAMYLGWNAQTRSALGVADA